MAKTDNRRTQTTRKLQVEPEPSPPALDIRACAAAYAWFCGPFVIGLVLVCLFATHGKNPWESEVFVGGIILSLVISTARFRVLIDSASISYRAPFGGSRSFRFVEIKKAELIARSGKGQTYYRLVILPKTGTRSMVINLKYCSRSNVTELFNVLETGAGRKVVNRNLAPISRIAQ